MKTIFYYTDVLPILGRGEEAINKIIRSLEAFQEASDRVKLIWHPWSGTERYLELNHSDVLDKYRGIVEEFRSEAWGKLDESRSLEETKEVLLKCNGYYGDISDLVYDAQSASIPVMLQNIDI